ncbi:Uncharacterised protein [Clostridioides difficile]|nr:Uncharacterised protein [Clostridioides difficile]SJO35074.1 Uncharacterised protein [Clostridioides difficile]SJO53948.1 Uncharacterised protein [Clostridioides difficile]SJO62438.1 Uncharacterised protein [Clostridioides difficile]SJR47070.1 Uncharacterised protein [Clostridioides difficile]
MPHDGKRKKPSYSKGIFTHTYIFTATFEKSKPPFLFAQWRATTIKICLRWHLGGAAVFLCYRHKPTIFSSKKVRPPPRDIPAPYMITHIIIILLIFHLRPIAFYNRAHFVFLKTFLKKFAVFFGIFPPLSWRAAERG